MENVLEYLLQEMSERKGARYSIPDMASMDYWVQLSIMKQILCQRSAIPHFPDSVLNSIDAILQNELGHQQPYEQSSIRNRYEAAQRNAMPAERHIPTLSIWKGDITTLASPTAIVNAANSQLLGCFQPSHRCIDNVIHSIAGPRLRQACAELMKEQNYELEPEGHAKVTPGFNMRARYVIHTVGPQIEQGKMPTSDEIEVLANCYKSCLDATETLECDESGVKSLVFCCISTGLFGFDASLACSTATETVIEWCRLHPDTTITNIIFNVFTNKDLELYQSQFSRLSVAHILQPTATSSELTLSHQPRDNSTVQYAKLLSTARSWLKNSTHLIISAGAGLSAATGLDYTSTDVFNEHLYGFKRYGFRRLYDVFGYDAWPSESARWSYFMNHIAMVQQWPRSDIYTNLLKFVKDSVGEENCMIRTSNADGFFVKNGSDASRISTPQGQYRLFQCLRNCREDAVVETSTLLEQAMPLIDARTQHLPKDFDPPVCRFCGGKLVLCVRGGDYFNEEPFAAQEEKYREFVRDRLNDSSEETKLTILEIGVGMNTPSVLRWHNERLLQKGKGSVKLVRIGLESAGCVAPQIEDQGNGIGLQGHIEDILPVLLQPS